MNHHKSLWILAVLLLWPLTSHTDGDDDDDGPGRRRSERTFAFPEPPHPRAIGTDVAPSVKSFVRRVTVSPPERVSRFGMKYTEVTGTIEGVGWGGWNSYAFHRSTYDYELEYVLRIPRRWDGTLVTFHHGAAPIPSWLAFERNLGPGSIGRVFHLGLDAVVSDVALHPERSWAFFAVNHLPVVAGGRFTTVLRAGTDDDGDGRLDEDPTRDDDGDGIGDEDPPDGTDNDGDGLVDEDPPEDDDGDGLFNEDPGAGPVDSGFDVPVARDTVRVAQYLLKRLRGREPDLTLGTGHSAGAYTYFMLDSGIDPLRTGGGETLAGDNSVRAYQPASGTIFDGFLALSPGGPAGPLPVDPGRGLSAPVVFLGAEADPLTLLAVRQVKVLVDAGLVARSKARIYMARNVTHQYADLYKPWLPGAFDLADLFGLPRGIVSGAGEPVKPLSGAMLDALRAWAAEGTPPPPSVVSGLAVDTDGTAGPDAVAFPHSGGGESLSFPFVDDPDFDQYVGRSFDTTGPFWLDVFGDVQQALDARVDSIILPETACRRGRFTLVQSPGGTLLQPFDETTFRDRWGTSAEHQRCLVETVDALVARGLYDPSVVPVDVAPGQFPNVIDLGSGGPVEVALLSTERFDATRVIPATVRLAGASLQGRVRHGRGSHDDDDDGDGDDDDGGRRRWARRVDVNADGRVDLVVRLSVSERDFHPADLVADVWGKTRDGGLFSGADVVQLELP